MRKAIVVLLLGVTAFVASPLRAAPTAAVRKELSAIRRGVLTVPALLRRRKFSDARKMLQEAEQRLQKLLDAAKINSRDRSVTGLKRLIQFHKTRLRRLPNSKRSGRGRTIRVPGGRSAADLIEKKSQAARKEKARRLNRDLVYWRRKLANPAVAGAPGKERERALFHVGVVSMRMKQWKPAATAFASLIQEFPDGPWTISARCRLIDLKLEHFLDLKGADAEIALIMKWTRPRDEKYFPKPKRGGKAGSKPATKKPSGEEKVRNPKPVPVRKRETGEKRTKRAVPSEVLEQPTEKQILIEAYRRVGLVHFVHGRTAGTRYYLLRARALRGRLQTRPSADERAEQRLLSRMLSRRMTTPLSVWKSRKDVFSSILFGDYLFESSDYMRSRDYATLLLTQGTIRFTEFQRSYLHYLRGRSLNGIRDRKQRQKAVQDFLAARKLAPKSRWADDALFLAGNACWNHSRNAARAIQCWQQLLKEYPRSAEADRSAFYVGIVFQQTQRFQDAKAAYESLLKDRPKSRFAELTKKQLKQVESELSRANAR
ncbi:MAG: tetratricopeptide repeat protein [Planctomycetes bacterium]|nr:tetratricopeptide repeat protein [Planctomycetota bacterium]